MDLKHAEGREPEPDDLVGPLRYEQVCNTNNHNELWNCKPDCRHHIVSQRRGGILCTKCRGWCCY
jgi:hypothetical protein